MRSARNRAAVLLGVLLAGAAVAAHPPRVTGDGAEETDIGNAIRLLREDPHLAHRQETVRRLRWKGPNSALPPQDLGPGAFAALLAWLAGSARLLAWVLGAVATAAALVWVLRALRRQSADPPAVPLATAPYVQGLDVQPASLPTDVGGAAAALLAAGQMREALSLLYRGALSRAIHRHGVAIPASSTEGEVLAAVAPRLAPPGGQYFGRLLALWQHAVYAAEPPATESVAALCREFGVLDGTVA